jgi:hypothetical protein
MGHLKPKSIKALLTILMMYIEYNWFDDEAYFGLITLKRHH